MQVTRQHVVDILRTAGLRELAEEAHRVLPDPASPASRGSAYGMRSLGVL
jgi:hypothetical protein